MSSKDQLWLDATLGTLDGYRRTIDAAVAQLDDQQLFLRPAPNSNSVAILLRHLAGNLQSRWDRFLTDDGEKPTRDRDAEFEDWPAGRQALMEYFDSGWELLIQSIGSLSVHELSQSVKIRGESHTVPAAILRSVTHISYHVGQLLLVARMVHGDEAWNWLTIAPGMSQQHNSETWGTPNSRSSFGKNS